MDSVKEQWKKEPFDAEGRLAKYRKEVPHTPADSMEKLGEDSEPVKTLPSIRRKKYPPISLK